MSRTFDARNKEIPLAVQNLGDQQPACFSSRESWIDWLDDNYRAVLGDGRARSAMNRGQVPDYCCDCTHGHEMRMTSQGRCAKALRRAEAHSEQQHGRKPSKEFEDGTA